MKRLFIVKLLIIFAVLFLLEYIILSCLKIEREKLIENMIQLMTLNVACLAFYTWCEDNRRSNIELIFAFDKRWDEIIEIIDDEFNKTKNEFAEKKADNEDKEYLRQLKKTQEKLKFLLEKMNYFEAKNKQEKSFIDFNPVVDGIDESVNLIFDLERINSDKLKEIFYLYKKNLEDIKHYIGRTEIYRNTDIKAKIEKTIENIASYENADSQEKDSEPIIADTYKDYICNKKVIGISIGNNRYFKPKADSNHYVYTSRNWNEEDNENYGTWYTIPKTGKGSVSCNKDYYFIVREANEENLYPYLFITNENLKSLIEHKENEENKNTGDNLIHFYFKWNKYDYTLKVTDERSGLDLPTDECELGEAELKGKTLYKKISK